MPAIPDLDEEKFFELRTLLRHTIAADADPAKQPADSIEGGPSGIGRVGQARRIAYGPVNGFSLTRLRP